MTIANHYGLEWAIINTTASENKREMGKVGKFIQKLGVGLFTLVVTANTVQAQPNVPQNQQTTKQGIHYTQQYTQAQLDFTRKELKTLRTDGKYQDMSERWLNHKYFGQVQGGFYGDRINPAIIKSDALSFLLYFQGIKKLYSHHAENYVKNNGLGINFTEEEKQLGLAIVTKNANARREAIKALYRAFNNNKNGAITYLDENFSKIPRVQRIVESWKKTKPAQIKHLQEPERLAFVAISLQYQSKKPINIMHTKIALAALELNKEVKGDERIIFMEHIRDHYKLNITQNSKPTQTLFALK